ncbi:hypothetical protein NBRC116493_21260 [Aurantivibrio infirmus]
MHDIADLESRGIPSGFIASSEFKDAAKMQASSLNFDAARTFVPHPIQDRTLVELQSLADNAVEEILAMVVTKK